ncbi:MAG: septum formation initiator family protein [Bifidobacterium sp.]|nr:septum formation initiator family protein [Bifidobacterium sp.]
MSKSSSSMTQGTKTDGGSRRTKTGRRAGAGPVAFFVSLFIIALGTIQIVSTFHTYALNLAELNGLKRQESALVAKKQDLENDISRWNDKAYVTAQARERLGFVFPGEEAVRVEHPEAVTGTKNNDKDDSSQKSDRKVLPWYSELAYSFKKADDSSAKQTSGGSSSHRSPSSSGGSSTSGSSTSGSSSGSQTTQSGQ